MTDSGLLAFLCAGEYAAGDFVICADGACIVCIIFGIMRAIFAPDGTFAGNVGLRLAGHRPLVDTAVCVAARLTILAIIDGHEIAASVRASGAARLVTLGECPD